MWNDYSAAFIRKNKSSSISIMVAALISALFLSLICSLFFNFWKYEVETIVLEEGDWQGRITIAKIASEDNLATIKNFANVENAVINEEVSEGEMVAIDIYFQNMRKIYEDMPLILEKLGLDESAASYHELLLSRYMIHDPNDEQPPLLMAFYLVILLFISLALILIIHNSFAVSMNERVHQFGIFSSIGATPKQIRTCLMQEAAVLCGIPIFIGSFIGIALSFGVIEFMNFIGKDIEGRRVEVFQYDPMIFLVTIVVSVVTVMISAWIPARKLSKLTPLEAIRNEGNTELKRKKHSRVLSLFFGIEGELAGNALRARKKALRTSTLSLTLSFLAFTMMLCFFTLSGISTDHTYFMRYQDAWDVMITLKDANIEAVTEIEEVREIQGVESAVVYQKSKANALIPKESMSDEVNKLGGLAKIAGSSVEEIKDFYAIEAPIVIMDDRGFLEYCEQVGATPTLEGSIVVNQIWDSINSNFRYKQYVPFIKEENNMIVLQRINETNVQRKEIGIAEKTRTADANRIEVPVIAYAEKKPVLREGYDDFTLVQVMPVSMWNQISKQIGNVESDTLVRILGQDGVVLDDLNQIESDAKTVFSKRYEVESENRIQERMDDKVAREGLMLILGGFCSLLALIGIADIFSNTLGFVYQRKREFAQYMSVGMTAKNMKKLFVIEALIIAGRPLLITLPLTIIGVAFMIKASYLNPMEFIVKAPVIPIAIFMIIIFGLVGLAYYIGGRRMMKCNLAETLRDDSMM